MRIENFVNNLKRDKARGDLAPHQIILLLSIQKICNLQNSNIISISHLIDTFEVVWKENEEKFKTKNCNLGMPLKVFVDKEYLEIDLNQNINDFRNKTELNAKIKQILVSPILKNILINEKSEAYLISRLVY